MIAAGPPESGRTSVSGGPWRRRPAVSSHATRGVLALSVLDSADEAMHAGASAFLRKPLQPLRVVSVVRDLLGTSELTRPAARQALRA